MINNLFDYQCATAGRLGINPFSPPDKGAIGSSGWNYNSNDWLSTTLIGPGAPRAYWTGVDYIRSVNLRSRDVLIASDLAPCILRFRQTKKALYQLCFFFDWVHGGEDHSFHFSLALDRSFADIRFGVVPNPFIRL